MSRSLRLALAGAVTLALVIGMYLVFHRPAPVTVGTPLMIYYTKLDGTTLSTWTITMRPSLPGESPKAHRAALALYAAVQAIAGPPASIDAIRFPSGTRVLGTSVTGTMVKVDLSSEVTHTGGGSFGEDGEFKALVYTLTSLPKINAVQITIDGKTVASLPGGHLALDEPLHRSDW